MAQLHGRVFGLPNRRKIGAAAVALLCALAASAHSPLAAQSGGESLGNIAARLTDSDAETRVEAFDTLRTLPATRIGDIETRLREIRMRDKPGAAAAYNTLLAIRHEMGSQRASDPIDLAVGTRRMIENRAPQSTLRQVAERIALLRALEAIGSRDSTRLMIAFYQRRWRVWQWEARHAVGRLGIRMLPALIEARRTVNRQVHRWAIGSSHRVGVRTPGDAVQQAPIEILPDVLKAFARISDLRAMPVVISFIDHPDPTVRAAARWGTEQYGQNAIWELRRTYRNKLGEAAPSGLGWQPTMRRLFEGLDARRLQPANELLEQGLAAAAAGDMAAMNEHFAAALRREPLLPRRVEMGPGVAQQAEAAAEAGDLDTAITGYRRALRLAPEHLNAPEWRSRVTFIEAEQAREAGVIDLAAYEAAVRDAPTNEEAQAVLSDLEAGGDGEVVIDDALREQAALVMALLGALLLAWPLMLRTGRFVHILARRGATAAAARREARAIALAEEEAQERELQRAMRTANGELVAEDDEDAEVFSAGDDGASRWERLRQSLPEMKKPAALEAVGRQARVAKVALDRLRSSREPASNDDVLEATPAPASTGAPQPKRISLAAGAVARAAKATRSRATGAGEQSRAVARAKAAQARGKLARMATMSRLMFKAEPPPPVDLAPEARPAPKPATPRVEPREKPAAPRRRVRAAAPKPEPARPEGVALDAMLFGAMTQPEEDTDPGLEIDAMLEGDTGLEALLLGGHGSDTSPGLVEAPDTLPGC